MPPLNSPPQPTATDRWSIGGRAHPPRPHELVALFPHTNIDTKPPTLVKATARGSHEGSADHLQWYHWEPLTEWNQYQYYSFTETVLLFFVLLSAEKRENPWGEDLIFLVSSWVPNLATRSDKRISDTIPFLKQANITVDSDSTGCPLENTLNIHYMIYDNILIFDSRLAL